MMLAFLRNAGLKDEVHALFAAMPGAAEAAGVAEQEERGWVLQWKAGCWVSLAGSQAFTSAWEKYGRSGAGFSPICVRKAAMSALARLCRRSPVPVSFFSLHSGVLISSCAARFLHGLSCAGFPHSCRISARFVLCGRPHPRTEGR